MILFEKGLEIKDEVAAKIGDQQYIENELRNYVVSRANAGLLKQREDEAKEEVKDFVKEQDVKKLEAAKEAGEVELKP